MLQVEKNRVFMSFPCISEVVFVKNVMEKAELKAGLLLLAHWIHSHLLPIRSYSAVAALACKGFGGHLKARQFWHRDPLPGRRKRPAADGFELGAAGSSGSYWVAFVLQSQGMSQNAETLEKIEGEKEAENPLLVSHLRFMSLLAKIINPAESSNSNLEVWLLMVPLGQNPVFTALQQSCGGMSRFGIFMFPLTTRVFWIEGIFYPWPHPHSEPLGRRVQFLQALKLHASLLRAVVTAVAGRTPCLGSAGKVGKLGH